MRPPILLSCALAALALASSASAASTRFERIAGYKSPGTPAKYNKVGILEFGNPKAKNVLVLNPGTSASAAYFAPLARSVVAKAKAWQVWAVERRENLLEDQSMADRAKAKKATPEQLFNYYLGWLQDSSVTNHIQPVPDSAVPFAREWGMNTQIQDLRRVVLRAKRRGGKVVVGGHSLGGSITTAYATWDFGGKPGATGLSGLVFIDGASSPTPLSAEDAQALKDKVDSGSPWSAIGAIPSPYVGLFNLTGSLLALIAPNEQSRAQDLKALPDALKPPFKVTNAGEYGYGLDTETSPAFLALAQGHLGHVADGPEPRGWDDAGELTPLRRFATMFSGYGLKGLDGTAWYHPARLSADSRAVADGNPNPGQEVLGVKAIHGSDLPKSLRLYAFAASLGGQRVLDGTTALATQSGIPTDRVTLIDGSATYAHNDPNSATPAKNAFFKGLLPFLRKVARGR